MKNKQDTMTAEAKENNPMQKKRIIILGISCFYHDAAAAIVVNGKLIAAAEEERFSRKKHDASFPKQAISFCLKQCNISINEIDYIAFYDKPLLKFERLLSSHLFAFPKSFGQFARAIPSWMNKKIRIPKIIKKELKYKGKIFFIDHHLSHAASSFLASPFKKAVLLTLDGVGEWATTSAGVGEENKITLQKEIHFPHSLGLLYSTATAHLGFSVNNSEYKVMGLAPYGKPVYLDKFRKLITVKEDGSYKLNMEYFSFHYALHMPSEKYIEEFGPIRKPNDPVTEHHQNLASSLQALYEEVLFTILNALYKETKITNLCMAGGCALNSVGNGKITNHTPFKKVFIQPAASDAGGSIGAALYTYNCILEKKRTFIQEDAYLGPSFLTAEIKLFLDDNNIIYKIFKNEKDLADTTAKLIAKNNVIGLFQGRMEMGPRALGNRSILSNPTNPKMQEILNEKVKHREKFRPFAPVITAEDVHKYFDIDKDEEPFMLFVYPIKKEKRKLLPTVTHVDGSGRLQTITKKQNVRYYSIIKSFEKITKVPVLVNTSFNIRGEPIVCTPQDAYRCMMGTGIDYLVIDKFIIARKDNPKDMWDSESLATD